MAISRIKTRALDSAVASNNLNIDAGTLFLDATNNRVGVANTSPTVALDVTGAVKSSLDSSISGLTVGRGAGAVATNTAVGAGALVANTSGSRSVAVGDFALAANTTGFRNVALGSEALSANTAGTYNTGLGWRALSTTTTGNENTASGYYALLSNTTGSFNTAHGASALQNNTTASNNTAVGFQAGYNNTTGAFNVLLGYQAGYRSAGAGSIGDASVFIGYTAGYSNQGNNNVGVGNGALNANTTGTFNVSTGQGSLSANTTGSNNTAFGAQALLANTTASENTAVGYQAGYSLTVGSAGAGGNLFIGYQAGYTTSTGRKNTFVGYQAGLNSSASGGNNAFFGNESGSLITTGTGNTIIGRYDGNQGGLDIRTLSNHIVISDGDGNPRIHVNSVGQTFIRGIDLAFGGVAPSIFRNTNSTCSGFHFTAPGAYPVNGNGVLNDNVMPLGGGSNRMSVIYAGTGTISTSDKNEKQDIDVLSDAEMRVAVAIKGLIKKFRWRDAVATKGENARIHVGVIAQEVQAAFEVENLSSEKYALFCSDTWYEFNGSSMDADGNRYTAESAGAVEKTRLGIRYDQLLAFIIAAL